jgi:uncharacterized NAD(P)/FAD-binding protein YdhS
MTGLSLSTDGLIMNQFRVPNENIFAVGPLRRGELWETTAVREIRQQATSIATEILNKIFTTDRRVFEPKVMNSR